MKPAAAALALLVALLGIGALATGFPAAQTASQLALSFNSYQASPVVLTDFSIEQDLAPVPPTLIAGAADHEMPRLMGGAAISAPLDLHGDGIWLVSARWVELSTDKAWTARIEVPIQALDVAYDATTLLVVFGPNGEMLIGSDKIGDQPSDRVDVARVCGVRTPGADRAWRLETGLLPEIASIMAQFTPESGQSSHCQARD